MNNKDQQQSNRQVQKKQLNNYARFTGTGFQMLVTIGLGVYGGSKLDERYPNKYQAYTIACSLVAIGISLFSVIKQVNKFSKKE